MFRPFAAIWKFFAQATSGVRVPADWLLSFIRGGSDYAGKRVSAEDALKLPEIWYAITRIAGNVGSLPCHQYRRDKEDDRKKSKMREHPAWRITHRRANPITGAAVFWETLMVHALLRGNGRAWIERNAKGQAVNCHLLPTNTKTVIVNSEKWHVATIVKEDGSTERVPYPDRHVVHIIGLSFDGIVGIDLVDFANESFGTSLSQLRATRKSFDNYGVPGLLLSAPKNMFKDDADAFTFLEQFREKQGGIENAGKTALLRDGMTATVLAQNMADMQTVELRGLSRQDAALWFLLEAIVGDTTATSYNSLEQKSLAYLVNCLMRWLVRIEQEFDEKLFSEKEKDSGLCYHKFQLAALLRSDSKSLADMLSKLITARVINPNTARDFLELDPYDGGEEYLNPAITPTDLLDSQDSQDA